MRTTLLAAAVLAASSWATTAPASGIAIAYGMSGGITVYPDFGACATVTSSSGDTFVGSFTAVGVMQGPGTRAGTVRTVVPIVDSGTWSYCVSGAYTGSTAGDAKYVLHVHSTTGEYVEVRQCVINRGSLACV